MFRGISPSLVTVTLPITVEMRQKGTHVGLIEWDVLKQWFIIVPTSQPIQ
jgi:hypothetical protein